MNNTIKVMLLLIVLNLSACAQHSGNTPDLPNTQSSPQQENQAKLDQAMQS